MRPSLCAVDIEEDGCTALLDVREVVLGVGILVLHLLQAFRCRVNGLGLGVYGFKGLGLGVYGLGFGGQQR